MKPDCKMKCNHLSCLLLSFYVLLKLYYLLVN